MNFNRLLDYRSEEFLSSMHGPERADLLKEILDQEPSKEVWQALIELFSSWPEDGLMEENLHLAEEKLAGWDDRLRMMWSHSGILYEGERLSSLARLVRFIQIYRREERGSDELLAIATSEYARQLAFLSIVHSEISSGAMQAMINSPYLADLRHLEINGTVMAAEDIGRLFQSSRFMRLQTLRLINVGLNETILADLYNNAIVFHELLELDLSHNPLGDNSASLLSQAQWLEPVERLKLRHDYLTLQGISKILSSPYLLRMNFLDVSENNLSSMEKPALLRLGQERHIQLSV